MKGDADALRASGIHEVTEDAVTTSGSGLDPDVSPTNALLQVDRIAKARGLSPGVVRQVISDHVEAQWLGFIGQAHVNVLKTNLDLDAKLPREHATSR